jgi:hypothetical protein
MLVAVIDGEGRLLPPIQNEAINRDPGRSPPEAQDAIDPAVARLEDDRTIARGFEGGWGT